MKIEFDPNKSQKNAAMRNLPFDLVYSFDFTTAITSKDERKNYPEDRYISSGNIGGRLHVLCFTPTADGLRVISLRKANTREVRTYEKDSYQQNKI